MKIYLCNAYSGATARALPSLRQDGAAVGQAAALADGDVAYVMVEASPGVFTVLTFVYDAGSIAAADTSTHPYAVRPIDYGSAGVWIESRLDGLVNVVMPNGALMQGLNMTSAASASNGIQVADNDNLDFGTGKFSVLWKGSLPDWTPAAAQTLIRKLDDASTYLGWHLYVNTSGNLVLDIWNGAEAVSYVSTSANGFSDDTAHTIGISVVRETALVAGSVSFYQDGMKLGASVAIPAAAPPSVSNGVPLYILGNSAARYAGVAYMAAAYNRALSDANHLSCHRNGIHFSDQWGSQTAKHASDFSAGENGYTATQGTVAGNIDGVSDGSVSKNDVLRFTINAVSSGHFVAVPFTWVLGKRYRVECEYLIPATNNVIDNMQLRDGSTAADTKVDMAVVGTWTAVSQELTVTNGAQNRIYMRDGTLATIQDVDGDDVVYLKNIVITELGATLAFEPEGIQSDPGQWLDSSSNKLHGVQPASGSSLLRPRNSFEIRSTNTWAGTHEAQYLGGVNQAVLPSGNIRIDSITMVIAGAAGNVILGDGSDTDRFVASVAQTAYLDCTIANRNHDGTNRKLVVDPDTNMTGSITTTIKGIILG